MSLFGSLQIAANALSAQQVGIQVAGQNIANANTPGYIREEVQYTPAPTQKIGRLLLGLGVKVEGIVQKSDNFLAERAAVPPATVWAETEEQAYLQLEQIIGELSDSDLSTSLTSFFASVSDVLNSPESLSTRNLAILNGQQLASEFTRLSERVTTVHDDLDAQIFSSAEDINRLTAEIRTLNIEITETEGGGTSSSDAVGLRDRRLQVLSELSKLIDVRVVEQDTGAVNVFSGGEYLVFEGVQRKVKAVYAAEDGKTQTEIRLADSDSPLRFTSGKVAGLTKARDEVFGGFRDQLDEFVNTFAFEFNKLYSSGQGLSGFQELTAENAVDDVHAALDDAGLPFVPEHGSFEVQIFDKQTGLTKTTRITVDLDGLDNDDTSLTDLAADLDAIDGLSATISDKGHLVLNSESTEQDFAFANDTSGVLAALGVNVFFTGSDARNLDVQKTLLSRPELFAASTGGVGNDADNAERLAGFLNRPLESQDNQSISALYDQLILETTQASAVSRAVADGLRVFEGTLENEHLAVTGVNIDEEVINMMALQRAFQATARYVATVSEMLDALVNL